MNGLAAALSPLSLPTSTSINDIQPAQLTLTVNNNSGTDIDLSGSQMRIDFIIDPGGDGSGGALLLSYSSGQDTANPNPTAVVNVTGAAAGGTSWSIAPIAFQDGLCSFLAVPPGQGQSTLAAGGSIAFNFNGIAVDLTEGSSTVTVTLLGSGDPGPLTPSPAITKTAPVAQINSFTADGLQDTLQLSPPNNQVALDWSTIAASCTLTWDMTNTTVVSYTDPNDQTAQVIQEPWIPVATPPPPSPPLQTQNAPVTAIVFQKTQFTLSAEGGGSQIQSQLTIDLTPTLTGPLEFSPYEQFELTWQAFSGMGASLSWSFDPNQKVTVSTTADGQTPYTLNDPLPATDPNTGIGTVYVVVNVVDLATPATVNFTLTLTAEAPPLPARVPLPQQASWSVGPASAALSSFTIVSVEVIDATNGQQAVTLAWTAQNATGFTITGYDGDWVDTGDPNVSANVVSGPVTYTHDQLTTAVPLNLPMGYGSVIYKIVASGYSSAAAPTATVQVYALVVTVSNLTASNVRITGPGQQTVTLNWQVQNATNLWIIAYYPTGNTYTPLIDAGLTTTDLTLPNINSGTIYYVIYAQGYPPQGDFTYVVSAQSPSITPIPVSNVVLHASQTVAAPSTLVTLTWSAVAATGFTLTRELFELLLHRTTWSFGAGVTTYQFTAGSTASYTIAALGYTGGGPNPSATVTIEVPKISKEGQEKVHKDHETPVPPTLSAGSGGAPGTGAPPSGSQQPFIGSDERPDVGGNLRGTDGNT